MRLKSIGKIFANTIEQVIRNKGGIAHLEDFYKALIGFKWMYKSEKSFRGSLRGILQSYSIEFNKKAKHDKFMSYDRDGYWGLSIDREIKPLYKKMKNIFGKYQSAIICRNCLSCIY